VNHAHYILGQLTFLYICFVITITSMKCHTFHNRQLAPNFILNVRKQLLRQNAEKILIISPWVEHKPLNGIWLWKWSNFGRDLNIQVTHSQVTLETWQSKCVKSPMRSDGVWLTLWSQTTSKDVAQSPLNCQMTYKDVTNSVLKFGGVLFIPLR
jgi:hypothetical protein